MHQIIDYNVLCTSVGNDGFQAVLRSLRQDERIKVYGCDSSETAYGLYICDGGFVIPPRSASQELITRIKGLIKKLKINCLFPLSTADQEFYSQHIDEIKLLGCEIIVSNYDSVFIANNKHLTYEFLNNKNIPLPNYIITSDKGLALSKLNYYRNKNQNCVIKLNRSTGAQGVKIVDSHLSQVSRFFNRDNIRISYEEAFYWLNNMKSLPEIMVCDYLPGAHISVDVLSIPNAEIIYFVRNEISHMYGMSIRGTCVDNEDLVEVTKKIIKLTRLKFINNIEFKADIDGSYKLMEINPRVPASIDHALLAGINIPLMAVASVLNIRVDMPTERDNINYYKFWNSIGNSSI